MVDLAGNERCHRLRQWDWTSEVESCRDDPWTRRAKLILWERTFGRFEPRNQQWTCEWTKQWTFCKNYRGHQQPPNNGCFRQIPAPLSLLILESYVLFAKDEKKRVAELEERPQVGSRSGEFASPLISPWRNVMGMQGRSLLDKLTSLSRLEETRGTAKEYQDWESLKSEPVQCTAPTCLNQMGPSSILQSRWTFLVSKPKLFINAASSSTHCWWDVPSLLNL